MKKNLKYIFGLSLVALLSGCVINVTSNTSDMNLSSEPTNSSISSSLDEEGREQDKLSIMFYTGGYGEEWLQEITDAYMSATGNYVEIVADATISSKAEAQLQSKNGSEYDIFISHDLNWQDYADRGLLANLDDVYSGTTVDGDKFKDRVIPAAEKISKYQGVRDSEPHYYKVCQTQGAGGFVYNEDLFKANNWEVPTTYEQLVKLCATISSTPMASDSSKTYIPFAWAGGGVSRDYYWDYPIYEWWAEMDGLEAIATWAELKGKDGKYSTGYENFDPNGRFANFKKAYKMWYDLVGTHPEYSNENAQDAQLITAQQLFFNGEAAMIPYGQWAKYEIKQSQKKEFNFNVRMMKTPRVNASSDYYNFMVGFGDSMIVPKNSPNVDIAKDFLKFMASKEACKIFVEKAQGPFLAFDYSDIDMSAIRAKDSYVDSMYEILTTCKNFTLSSNSPLIVANGDIEIQPWIGNNRYYSSCMTNPAYCDPDTVFDTIYTSAQGSWRRYCNSAEVD